MSEIQIKPVFTILIFTGLLFFACDRDPDVSPADQVEAMPYDLLSEYEFFKGDLKNLDPNDRIIPYDLNTPLFSNFADKARFIHLPPDKQAAYTSGGVFDFPVGTVLIKTFYYSHDLRNPALGRTIYETRLLIHKSEGWEAANYLWDDAQNEAAYYIAGKDVNVSWVHLDGTIRSTLYHIPNKNECKGCHNESENLIPIGPRARNLNKDYSYKDGPMNQLVHWKEEGILAGAPDPVSAPKEPVWNDANSGSLNDRARAYLDINCAHCHNVLGPANSSGMFLTYDETDSTALGVCKPPVAAGTGSGGLLFNIIPGQPDNSIMIYRMNSVAPAIAMPELARSVIHDEGVQLIRDWISSLPPAGCE